MLTGYVRVLRSDGPQALELHRDALPVGGIGPKRIC